MIRKLLCNTSFTKKTLSILRLYCNWKMSISVSEMTIPESFFMESVDIGMARWYNQGVLGGMTGELYDSFQSGKWFWTL